ncbi:hypothetical protein [Polyangium sp. 15x6]|uniref:hypothetical protein n=1 Tax=Polyangium sp. 15x6 TaxID=3042687 RepID=UPI00249BB72A|nr:hypothetical protein [Polyangium sp. 15x6]MDI3290176.1 hypothetical protein [Polyangium sp. 15x6]
MIKHIILALSVSLLAVACGGGTPEAAAPEGAPAGDAKPAEGAPADAAKPAEGAAPAGDQAAPPPAGDQAAPK